MSEVGVHEAKTHLSRLLRQVMAGDEVIITRGGTPIARLVPVHARRKRVLGGDQGVYAVPEDFDAPLPGDVLDAFEQ
jgi:prevent-host-death family protein